MCGIAGYLGKQEATSVLLDCLGRLEYRGYDSAGVAIIQDGSLKVCRSVGKNSELEILLQKNPIHGNVGIAHTRWATHGRPAEKNSHPHADCTQSLAIVHNGIIENHEELRRSLELSGHVFTSETDSEVIAHLFEADDEEIEITARRVIPTLRGAFALAVLSQKNPDQILVARNGGPPIVIGYADDGCFIASDITAILHHTRDIRTLENGEIAIVSSKNARIINYNGDVVSRKPTRISWETKNIDKSGYPDFMLKEIYEQPDAIRNTIYGQTIHASGRITFPEGGFINDAEMASIKRVTILACGTSWHAALVGKYMIELLARTPVDVDVASEYRYRPHIPDENSMVISISQSGETADTLAAIKEARSKGSKILSICNVLGSSMTRESDGVIYTHAGPEIGVASTKAFTCQLTALMLFAISFGQTKGLITSIEANKILDELGEIPRLINRMLEKNDELERLSEVIQNFPNVLYLGRGVHYPLALEGALKLKEISYIHAEGYPAGEMKHGPIALIDRHMPVVIIAPLDRLYSKIIATIEEVKARDGIVIALASEGDTSITSKVDHVFYLPNTSELLISILAAIPLQLLAYHIAVQRGCDVDKPRNLAKSVTVD
jgi:glucosamine--fructose-6-phosphate aminotransferase (isomerizing)